MRILGLSKARHLLEGFFYTNLYLIFIVWSLSWESIQLQKLPQNSILFYLLSASATFLFYLYAYRKDTKTLNQNNLRSVYFYNHPKTILFLVNLFRFIFLVIAIYLLLNHPINTKIIFSFPFWVAIATFSLHWFFTIIGLEYRYAKILLSNLFSSVGRGLL